MDKGELKKHLIKPIPAKYHQEYKDPFSNYDPVIEYYFTDETGNIKIFQFI